MDLLYGYLTGPRFRHRIEAIVEKLGDLQGDLIREKTVTMRLWAKREKQIQAIVEATAGMYGDMQGIAGQAMQEIPSLEISVASDGIIGLSDDTQSLTHTVTPQYDTGAT